MKENPLARHISLLELILRNENEMTLSELAEAASLPLATVHRLLRNLVETRLVAPGREHKKSYTVGPRMTRLLQFGIKESALKLNVEPVLKDLARELDETAYLARITGNSICPTLIVFPDSDMRGYVHPGSTMVVHAAASAKAILAYQSDATLKQFLAGSFHAYTARTLTSLSAVMEELGQVRQQGHAICDQEIGEGIVAHACPVIVNDEVVYSVSVIGPADRLGKRPLDEVIRQLRDAAKRLSDILQRSPGSGA